MKDERQIGRYGRFWSAFRRLPVEGNSAESVKDVLVSQYTRGRTSHLHEMTPVEYDRLCRAVEREAAASSSAGRQRPKPVSPGLRALRSRVLVEMRIWGVPGVRHNSVDWQSVDRFCLDSRIAGKRFCLLQYDELEALLRKLTAMVNKKLDADRRA